MKPSQLIGRFAAIISKVVDDEAQDRELTIAQVATITVEFTKLLAHIHLMAAKRELEQEPPRKPVASGAEASR